jgi:hypothetical protein
VVWLLKYIRDRLSFEWIVEAAGLRGVSQENHKCRRVEAVYECITNRRFANDKSSSDNRNLLGAVTAHDRSTGLDMVAMTKLRGWHECPGSRE